MNATDCLMVGIGGAIGCVCRYVMQQSSWLASDRTYPTLAVNIIGCLLIGIAAALIESRGLPQWIRLVCITGFMGGFTTYSTFTLDAASLLQTGRISQAAIYLLITLGGGLTAYLAGFHYTLKLSI